jgi:hypothetical protein
VATGRGGAIRYVYQGLRDFAKIWKENRSDGYYDIFAKVMHFFICLLLFYALCRLTTAVHRCRCYSRNGGDGFHMHGLPWKPKPFYVISKDVCSVTAWAAYAVFGGVTEKCDSITICLDVSCFENVYFRASLLLITFIVLREKFRVVV